MFPISTSQPGPLHSLSPCGSIDGQSAGITQCISAHPKAVTLNLFVRFILMLTRGHTQLLLGLGILMERKLLPVAPAPWLEVQGMDSISQMASQYIVTGCGQRRAHSQCHHVEGCGHCSGLNNVSLKFIPPGASECKSCLFGNRVFADELL